jgi:hypothetical protein
LGRATKEENKIFMLIMNSLDLSKVYGFESLMTSQHYLMGPWDESPKHNYLSLFHYRLTWIWKSMFPLPLALFSHALIKLPLKKWS